MTDDKKENKKVVSITNGKPIKHGLDAVEVNPAVIAALEKGLQLAWAGEMDQVVILGISDETGVKNAMIAGHTHTPSEMYSMMAAIESEYMEQFIKPEIFGYEEDWDEQ